VKNVCYLCEKELHAFMTTPIFQTPDGELHQMCEECEDKNFPGWFEDEDEE